MRMDTHTLYSGVPLIPCFKPRGIIVSRIGVPGSSLQGLTARAQILRATPAKLLSAP